MHLKRNGCYHTDKRKFKNKHAQKSPHEAGFFL